MRETCINQQRAQRMIRIETVAEVLKRGRTHNWINYSRLTVSFSTVCLTAPVVRISLVSRNRCVPGHWLNSALGAGAWQLRLCCNNYHLSLLGPPLLPFQIHSHCTTCRCLRQPQWLSHEFITSLICLSDIQRIEVLAIYLNFLLGLIEGHLKAHTQDP